MTENPYQQNNPSGDGSYQPENGRTESPQFPQQPQESGAVSDIHVNDRLVGRRYEVQLILVGGMDVVYKCLDTVTDTVVGLKTIQTGAVMSDRDVNQMKANFKLVHNLSHEHIIRVNTLEFDKARRQWFLVMDWVEGENLEMLLRRSKDNCLPPEECIRLLRQVARALDYAHNKHVVHRDVKSMNIMVKASDRNALLIDFGIAKSAVRPAQTQKSAAGGSMTTTSGQWFAGTAEYKSPEQWRGEKTVTAASDVYSLGVTAYRCLAGHLPFMSQNDAQLQQMVQSYPIPVILTLPPDAGVVLSKAMAKEPGKRYSSCVAFVDDLAKALYSPFVWGDYQGFVDKLERCSLSAEPSKFDRGQTFGTHVDSFMASCRAAKEEKKAFLCDEYRVYELYRKADDEWRWLERNTPLRTAAAARLEPLAAARRKAEAAEAEQYAATQWQEALRRQAEATSRFEAGEFEAASDVASLAEVSFREAAQAALSGHIDGLERKAVGLLEQNEFEKCAAIVGELAVLDAGRAANVRRKAEQAKAERIRRLEDDIRKAIDAGRLLEQDCVLRELEALSPEAGRRWKQAIEEAKKKRLRELKADITAHNERNDFTGAYKLAADAKILDAEEGILLSAMVDAAKAAYIRRQGGAIRGFVGSRDFAKARSVAAGLSQLDVDEARRQAGYIDAEEARLVDELEKSVSEAIQGGRFDLAERRIQALRPYSGEKADNWKKTLAVAVLEQAITDSLSAGDFDAAAMTAEELRALSPEKAGEWAAKVRDTKTERIDRIVDEITNSIAEKHFAEAEAAAQSLRALDSAKADEWAAKVRDARKSETESLLQAIPAAIEAKVFGDAERAIESLRPLEPQKAETWAEKVRAEKAAEVERLIGRMVELVPMPPQEVAEAEAKELEDIRRTLHQLDPTDSWKARFDAIIKSREDAVLQRLVEDVEKALAAKQFDAAVATAEKLRPVNAVAADEWLQKVLEAKAAEVRTLVLAISDAMGGGHFDEAEKAAETLRLFEPQAAEGWRSRVRVKRLEQSISAALDADCFDKADGMISELMYLDETAAANWRKTSLNKQIMLSERAVSDAFEQGLFEEMGHLIVSLNYLDAKKAAFWEKKLKSAVNDRILTIEELANKNLNNRLFDKAEEAIRPLEVLDKDVYHRLTGKITSARSAYIGQLKQEVTNAIDLYDFEKANETLLKLRPLVKEADYQTWLQSIETGVEGRVAQLEQLIGDAVDGGHLEEAEALLPELEKLAPTKAGDWSLRIKIKRLVDKIQVSLTEGRIADAEKSLCELSGLDPKAGDELSASIQARRQALVAELEAAVQKAIEEKNYEIASQKNVELRALADEKAAAFEKEIAEGIRAERRARLRRIAAVCVVLCMLAGLAGGAFYGYGWYVQGKAGALYDELTALRPSWETLGNVSKEANQLSDKLKKAKTEEEAKGYYDRLDELSTQFKGMASYPARHAELEQWCGRIIPSGAKAEWRGKADGLKPSAAELEQKEALADVFKTVMDGREDLLKELSNTEKKAAHQKELAKIEAEIAAHYRDYVQDTFQWKGLEAAIQEEKDWRNGMMKQISDRLSAIGANDYDKDEKQQQQEVSRFSEATVMSFLPLMARYHDFQSECKMKEIKLHDLRQGLMKHEQADVSIFLNKMEDDLKDMESALKNERTALKAADDSTDELKKNEKGFWELTDWMKKRGKTVEASMGSIKKSMNELSSSMANVKAFFEKVKAFEMVCEDAKAFETECKNEKKKIVTDKKDYDEKTKPIDDKYEEAAKALRENHDISGYPVVKGLAARLQSTNNDWSQTKARWLGTIVVIDEESFEKNLNALVSLYKEMDKLRETSVQNAVSRGDDEAAVMRRVADSRKQVSEYSNRANAITEEQKKKKAKVLHELEAVFWIVFPKVVVTLPEGVPLELVKIRAGAFEMGSPEEEFGRRASEETPHEVQILRDYWIGRCEVTQGQYKAVMEENPSEKQGDDLPVENVTWDKAMEFCKKLTELEEKAGRLPDGYVYSLPTEAMWEYACRAGTSSAFSNGKALTQDDEDDVLSEIAWYTGNSADSTHPCGGKKGNDWWLHDMHGNVWEWCREEQDGFGLKVWRADEPRILKGGSWSNTAVHCRSASRIGRLRSYRADDIGFRVALVPK